jgi:hypothetical protein
VDEMDSNGSRLVGARTVGMDLEHSVVWEELVVQALTIRQRL